MPARRSFHACGNESLSVTSGGFAPGGRAFREDCAGLDYDDDLSERSPAGSIGASAEMPLYDAVYPTMMYYQDKLGGTHLSSAMSADTTRIFSQRWRNLQIRLRVPVRRMEPKTIEDIYKPALGAAVCMGQFNLNLSTRPFKPIAR